MNAIIVTRGKSRERFQATPQNCFVIAELRPGPVAGLVGIDGGVVSGVFNLESPSVEAPGRRPRHEKCYHGT